MKLTKFALTGVASVLFACTTTVAAAADYPTGPITLVIPFSAGGGADNAARILAQGMEAVSGKSIIVENKPGGSGAIAASTVLRAKPDGYTVLYDASSFAINAVLRKLSYDPNKDFKPVTQAVVVPNILVVATSSPYNTLNDYLQAGKKEPGKHTYASYGPGSLAQMAGELLKKDANVDLVHIPYKGGAPAMVDVMGGHVDAYFANAASSLNYVTQGKLRALAVTSTERMKELPDTPTMMEAGVKDFSVYEWNGLLVPAATPDAVVQELANIVKAAIARPDIQEKLAGLGLRPVASSPAEFAEFLKNEQNRWAEVAKANNITLD